MNTKRYLVLTIVLLLIFSSTFSQTVSIESIKILAEKVYRIETRNRTARFTGLKIETLKFNNSNCLYLLNFKEGFMLFAADEKAPALLAYSLDGNNFDPYSSKNEAAIELIEQYKKQIYKLSKGNYQKNSQWKEFEQFNLATLSNSIDKRLTSSWILGGTKWNQSWSWNKFCPTDAKSPSGYNGHVPAGCVAVAMAQIMKFHNYPSTGNGSNSYTGSTHPEYGTLSANFGTTTYNWASMNATTANDYSSTLIYHCGVSVNMDYDPDGSSAYSSSARNALVNNFKYSSKCRNVYKSSFTDYSWAYLLRREIDNQRPVYYSAVDPDPDDGGGHAFIVDGYGNDWYSFHINWGWGGSEDGYFFLSDFSPNIYDFKDQHAAIIKIAPSYQESIPFSETFETSCPPQWDFTTIGHSLYEQVMCKNLGDGFGTSMLFHKDIIVGFAPKQKSSSNFDDLVSGCIPLDLYNKKNVNLSFWWKSLKVRPLVAENGIFLSTDGGESYIKIFSFDHVDFQWRPISLNLNNIAAANGKALNEISIVKFQYTYSSSDDLGDYLAIDNVVIDEIKCENSIALSDVTDPQFGGQFINGIYRSVGTITATNVTIPQNYSVSFLSQSNTLLKTGFKSVLGSKLHIASYNCSNPQNVNEFVTMEENRTSISKSSIDLNVNSNDVGKVQVYPNPTNGNFSISMENLTGQKKVNIYSISGACIYSIISSENEINIDLSDKSKGVYFIKVSHSGGMESIKLMLQ